MLDFEAHGSLLTSVLSKYVWCIQVNLIVERWLLMESSTKNVWSPKIQIKKKNENSR